MADLSLATIHYKLARDQKLCEFEIDQLSHYKAAPATSAHRKHFLAKSKASRENFSDCP
jgi:hypothetical protein